MHAQLKRRHLRSFSLLFFFWPPCPPALPPGVAMSHAPRNQNTGRCTLRISCGYGTDMRKRRVRGSSRSSGAVLNGVGCCNTSRLVLGYGDESWAYKYTLFAHGCWAVRPRTSGGYRDGFFLRDFLIRRAAFDTLERAKHWTAFHVAQTIHFVLNQQ